MPSGGLLLCILVDGMMSKSPRRYKWDAMGKGQTLPLTYDHPSLGMPGTGIASGELSQYIAAKRQ